MKQIFLSSLAFISIMTCTAQTSQIRDIKPFHTIEVSGAATVILTQSDTISVKVVAGSSEIDRISTTVESDALILRAKGDFKSPYKIYVSGNHIHEVTANGASRISMTNTLLTDSLSIFASGASHVELSVNTKSLSLISSGVSDIQLNGSAQTLSGTISGGSSLKAYKLNCAVANIHVSGVSSAKVFASDRINASATGSSMIRFKGEPKEVNAEASSSSSITRVIGDEVATKSAGKDSTTFNFKKKKLMIIDKIDNDSAKTAYHDDDFNHWAGFSMGVNGWLSNGSFTMPKNQDYMSLNYGKSLNFQLNLFEKHIHLYKNYVNLVTGLGFEWNQYEFDNKTKLNADSSYTFGRIDSTNSFNYKKNRLKSTFINVPLLVEFNTNKNPHKAFHLAVGVIGGYRIGSRTRQILEQDNNTIKVVRKDSYNLNPFRLNAHASVGYHNFTLFADYSLTTLFQGGKGPELYPFTLGVRLISF